MSVWYAIPSARSLSVIEETIGKWLAMGYKVMLWRDKPAVDDFSEIQWAREMGVSATWQAVYPGYSQVVNALCREILARDPAADWIVTGGDDVEPDPNKRADEIGRECSEYFAKLYWSAGNAFGGVERIDNSPTFGVMQPTGDDWYDFHGGKRSRIIERIAGSPWMGLEFCRRMNGGAGPLWPEYTHCFEDEELQNVAQKLGVLWQRPDLTHMHYHWSRQGHLKLSPEPPAHLKEATSRAHWEKYKALFEQRKAAGFPGHEPIA